MKRDLDLEFNARMLNDAALVAQPVGVKLCGKRPK